MIPNINEKTGVHYGVCNGNYEHLPDDWFDMFEPDTDCGNDCENCNTFDNDTGECEDSSETETWICDTPDFKAEYNSNTNIIMIFFSKKTILCRPCSPCYPNAGDLDSPDDYGIETYTFNY